MTSLAYATILDAVGSQVTVESLDGTSYTGKLESVNAVGLTVRLSCVVVTLPNGSKDAALSITVPGSQQKFIRLPDAMKFAPRFTEMRKGNGVSNKKKAPPSSASGGGGFGGGNRKRQEQLAGGRKKGASSGGSNNNSKKGKKV